jgi:hypothetical protein
MKSAETTINGQRVIAYEDGSIEKPFHNRRKRTFGGRSWKGYMQINIGGRTYQVHRIIARAFGVITEDNMQIDHINGRKEDNRLCNLRQVDCKGNNRAYKKNREGSSSEYRGVRKYRGKWQSQITRDGKYHHIGSFTDETEAARAYDAKAIELGFLPESMNFPNR